VIALSATPGDSEEVLQQLFGDFDISRKGLDNLIQQGRLPKPEIFVYNLTLDTISYDGRPSERTLYDAVNNRIKSQQITYARSNRDSDKFKMLQSGLERKRLLGSLKMPYVSYLLWKIWEKRYICFCPTIEIARDLLANNPLGGACVNSKNSKKQNEETIARFNNGDIDHLFVVGMLTEGTNLNNIEAGVLIQLDKGERTMIQKLGRTLRAEHPKMYFFSFKDTIDEKLTENIVNNIDNEYIRPFDFRRDILKNRKENNYGRFYRT
jgi:superfamily II DNA or RNA helicase